MSTISIHSQSSIGETSPAAIPYSFTEGMQHEKLNGDEKQSVEMNQFMVHPHAAALQGSKDDDRLSPSPLSSPTILSLSHLLWKTNKNSDVEDDDAALRSPLPSSQGKQLCSTYGVLPVPPQIRLTLPTIRGGFSPSTRASFASTSSSSTTNFCACSKKEVVIDFVLDMLQDDDPQGHFSPRRSSFYQRNDLSPFQKHLLRDCENGMFLQSDSTGNDDGNILGSQEQCDERNRSIDKVSRKVEQQSDIASRRKQSTSALPTAPLLVVEREGESSSSRSFSSPASAPPARRVTSAPTSKVALDYVDFIAELKSDDSSERSLYKRTDLTAYQNDLLRDGDNDHQYQQHHSFARDIRTSHVVGGHGYNDAILERYQWQYEDDSDESDSDDDNNNDYLSVTSTNHEQLDQLYKYEKE